MKDKGRRSANANDSPELLGDCPWDMWLVFRNVDVESNFMASANQNWMSLDSVANRIPLLLGPAKIFSWQSTGILRTAVHHLWLILSSVVAPLIILANIRSDPILYASRRININSGYRLFVSIGNGLVAVFEDTLHVWRKHSVGLDIVSKTPIPGMMLMGIALRIPFRRHMLIQGIIASLNWLWVFQFCEACHLDKEIEKSANMIGWATEGAMQRIATLGFPVTRPELKEGQYSCLLIGFFYHWWVGFVIPSAVAYTFECLSRSRYLEPLLKNEDVEKLKVATWSRLILIGLVFVVGSQTMWFAMKILFTWRPDCWKVGRSA